MEIINVPRAFGKTTNLIMRAVKTGYPIIVGTSSQKNVLKDRIRRITDKEVEVYTIFDFCDNNKFRGKGKPENVLIDVLEMIADCVCAGMARSGEIRDLEINPDILNRAVQNTVKLIKDMIVVEEL